jgi:outer membrane protein TolC
MKRLEAKIETSDEKLEALLGTLLSWMDIQQTRAQAIQEEMEAKMNRNQEKIEATKTLIHTCGEYSRPI